MVSMKRAIASAVVSIALCAPAAPARAQPHNGRIVGRIVDDHGKPVAGATVEAQNAQATPPVRTAVSDDNGRFGLMGLRSGTWMVMVTARGHEPAALGIDVQPQRPGATITIPLVRIPIEQVPTFTTLSSAEVLQELDRAAEHLAGGRPDQALAIYDALLKKAPALTTLHVARSRALRARGDFEAAREACRTLLAREPANLRARYELALTELDAGESAAARRELERIVADAPGSLLGDVARERLASLPH
ncbi:MAG TPA: carboxypeptidase regulatory-like domain-containing protein [Vicinamibacterales bacterium]